MIPIPYPQDGQWTREQLDFLRTLNSAFISLSVQCDQLQVELNKLKAGHQEMLCG
jgi:hypothetical protein